MRLILLLTILLSGCGLFKINTPAPTVPEPEEQRTTVQDVLDNTIALMRADGQRFCSGVAVEGTFLTAYHCIEVQEDFLIEYRGETFPAALVMGWKKHDLAQIDAIGAKTRNTLEMSPWEPQYGMRLIWAGHPLGDATKRLFVGNVAAPQNLTYESYFDIDGQVIPGNSGGPVVDEKGRLIGILSATAIFIFGVPQPIDIGHAVRPEYLKKILNPNRNH